MAFKSHLFTNQTTQVTLYVFDSLNGITCKGNLFVNRTTLHCYYKAVQDCRAGHIKGLLSPVAVNHNLIFAFVVGWLHVAQTVEQELIKICILNAISLWIKASAKWLNSQKEHFVWMNTWICGYI